MLDNSCLVLPPNCNNNKIYATLNITINSVHLLQLTPKPIKYRISMWGLKSSSKTYAIKQGCQYKVKTPYNLLREYLADSKVSTVYIMDTRNNQQIGCALINWQLFITPSDYQKFSQKNNNKTKLKQIQSPFMEHKFQACIPIVNYRKKKVGEAYVQIQYQPQQPKIKKQQISECDYNYNIENMEQLLSPIQQNQKNILKKSRLSEPSQSIIRNNRNRNQYIPNKQYNAQNTNNNNNINQQNRYLNSNMNNRKISGSEFHVIQKGMEHYEVQLSLLKMQANDLITNISKDQNNKQSVQQIIKFVNFITSKPNILLDYMDIYVTNKQKDSPEKHLTIYPIRNNQFDYDLKVQRGDTITVIIQKCKGSFLIDKIYSETKMLGILNNKNQKIGHLHMKIQPCIITSYPPKQKTKQVIIKPYPKVQNDLNRNNIQKQIKSGDTPKFLIVTIKQVKHFYLSKPKVFIRQYQFQFPLPSRNIIPLNEMKSQMGIQLRDNKNSTVSSHLIPTFKSTNINSEVLDCVAVFDNRIDMDDAYIQLQMHIGTMKQVNYHLCKQSKSLPHEKNKMQSNNASNQNKKKSNPYSQRLYTNQDKQISMNNSQYQEKSNSNMNIDKFSRNKQKKHHTEMQRVKTQPISEYERHLKEEREQSEDMDPIYLVEIFTRFLHSISAKNIPERTIVDKKQFRDLMQDLIEQKQQQQVIDIATDIFIQDDKIEYDQFLRCCKSYRNFLQLWWRLRAEALIQIIQLEPECQQQIEKYSELGTIKKQTLWKRALPKVTIQVRQNIQKLYHITSEAPVASIVLLNDLKTAKTNPQQLPQIIYPQLMVELGRLIRQTIQNNISADAVFQDIQFDRANIKIICDIFENIGISLSYWESLMVTEQLKAWYNIDFELGEGIINISTVEVWIRSSINRRKSITNSRSQMNKTQKSQSQSFLGEANKLIEQANKKYTPEQNKSAPRAIQNKSAIRSELNQQQILNIANLLRDNDNYMHTISSQKYVIDANMTNQHGRILPQGVLNTQENYSEYLAQESKQESYELKKQPTKFLHIIFKQLKLKSEQFPYSMKLQATLFQNVSHYFYINKCIEVQSKQLVQKLESDWQKHTSSLSIYLRPEQGREQLYQTGKINNQETIYGFLPSDQIKESKNRTLILYQKNKIIGKLSIQIKIEADRPKIASSQKQHDVWIQLFQSDAKSSNNQEIFSIELINDQCEIIRKFEQNKWNHKNKLEIPNDYYRNHCRIIFDNGICSIPLQQLCFRKEITGDYPVISQDGRFLKTIHIILQTHQNIIQEALQNKQHAISQKHKTINQKEGIKLQTTEQQKTGDVLVLVDYFCTIDKQRLEKDIPQKKIFGNFYLKDAVTREVIHKFDYFQHQIQSLCDCTSIKDSISKNYIILNSKNSITIQMEHSGRPIARGQQVIDLLTIGADKIYFYPLIQYTNRNLQIYLSLRVLQTPKHLAKYKFERICCAFSDIIDFSQADNQRQQQGQKINKILIQVQKKRNLTMTQLKLIREIIIMNSSNNCLYYNTSLFNDPGSKYELIAQILYHDDKETGKIQRNVLSQILITLFNKYKEHMLYQQAQKYISNKKIQNKGYQIQGDGETRINLLLDSIVSNTEEQSEYPYWKLIIHLFSGKHEDNKNEKNKDEIVSKNGQVHESSLKYVSQICENITKRYQRRIQTK